MSEIHEGGCVCGSVRYRVRGEPVMGIVCHCRFCQRRLGSAFALLAYFNEQDVEFTSGQLAAFEHRSDESDRWLKMGFCPHCGTTVTHIAEVRPGMRAIAGGTFDDPAWFQVDRHIWTQSRQPCVAVPADVKVFPQGSAGVTAPKRA